MQVQTSSQPTKLHGTRHNMMCCFVFLTSSDGGATDSEGKRPLHFAAHGKSSHAKDVVDVLIKESASDIGN